MEEVNFRLKVEADKAVSSVEKVNDSFEKTADNVEKAEKQTKDLNKATKKSPGAIKKVSAGFKALGTALKGAGIGLVVAGVVKLTDALSQNQTVVDAVNKVFKTIDIVFQQTTTAITNAFDSVGKLNGGFKSSVAVIKGLINIALAPFKLLIDTVKLGTQEAQLAWEESFFGDGDTETIKRLNKGIKETQKSIVDTRNATIQSAKDVAKNFTGFISEIGTFASKAVDNVKTVNVAAAKDSADAIIQLRKQVALEESQQEAIALRRQTEAERQRKERDDVRNSIEERIKANDELGEVLRTQAREEREIAQRRVRLAQLELAQNPQNIEAQNALQEAKNGVLEIEERIEGVTAEQRTNEAALQQERKDNLAELKQLGLDEQQRKVLEAEQELERRREQIRLNVEDDALEKQLLLEAKREYDNTIAELENDQKEKQKENAQELIELEKNKRQARVDTLNNLINIAGQESKIGKALFLLKQGLAIKEMIMEAKKTITFANLGAAKSTVATAEGTAQTAKVGFPQNIPLLIGYAAQAAAILTSIKSATSAAKSTASSVGGSGAGSGGATQQAQQRVQAPDFNIVGDAGNNEIANAIGNRNGQPTRAFVVSRDISSQAELNRNIEEEASLG